MNEAIETDVLLNLMQGTVVPISSMVRCFMSGQLQDEADRASEMLSGKVVRIIRRHTPTEVLIEFHDGTRLYVDSHVDGLDLSITSDTELGVSRILAWYGKGEPGYLVATENLNGIRLSELREMFGVSAESLDDPLMYGCYDV